MVLRVIIIFLFIHLVFAKFTEISMQCILIRYKIMDIHNSYFRKPSLVHLKTVKNELTT